MPLDYRTIRIFTSEQARVASRPIHEMVVDLVAARHLAARCVVLRGSAGCYESGETATEHVLALSYDMPIVIEIVLPAAEVDALLPDLTEAVVDGIVLVEPAQVVSHRTQRRLIPRQLRVRDVMTTSPKTVRPDSSVREVIRLLLSNDFNGAPVVDERSRPVGIITQGDLIRRADMPVRLGLLDQFGTEPLETYLGSLGQLPAERVMTSPVVTARPDEPLGDAVNRMLERGLKRLPVVDADGVLVGILARLDVFRAISRTAPDLAAMRARSIDVAHVRYVRDVMRRDTQTVGPDASVEQVIRIIGTNDIQRVAVVDERERLLGLISDRDLLAAFGTSRETLWQRVARRFTAPEQPPATSAGDLAGKTAAQVMRTDLVTVAEETPIDDAVRLMAERGLKRLPVIDEQGRFGGMISRDSLLRAGLA